MNGGLKKKLRKQQRDIRTNLRAIDVALEALELFDADGVDAPELLLLEAKKEQSQLNAELKRVRHKKKRMEGRRTQLEQSDSRRRSADLRNTRKIVPEVGQQSVEGFHTGDSDEAPTTSSAVEEDLAPPPPPRRQMRRRKVRVIRRSRKDKKQRAFSKRFLKKVMEYHARKQRLKCTAAALEQGETQSL